MPTCISPKYTDQTFGSNPTIEDKILVFENRVLGWNIAPAKSLNSVPHAGHAIVSIFFRILIVSGGPHGVSSWSQVCY